MAEEGRYTYAFPRPMVTVDAVVFGVRGATLEVVLIERGNDPYRGMWAVPGGFVDMDEPLEAAVLRELEEETGLTGIALEQFHAFGQPGRDPRGRNITVSYVGLVCAERHEPRGDDDAREARWFPVDSLPPLAFDHVYMIGRACAHLRAAAWSRGVGRQCLCEPFTMEALEPIYAAVLGAVPRTVDVLEGRLRLRGIVTPADRGPAPAPTSERYRFVQSGPRTL